MSEKYYVRRPLLVMAVLGRYQLRRSGKHIVVFGPERTGIRSSVPTAWPTVCQPKCQQTCQVSFLALADRVFMHMKYSVESVHCKCECPV